MEPEDVVARVMSRWDWLGRPNRGSTFLFTPSWNTYRLTKRCYKYFLDCMPSQAVTLHTTLLRIARKHVGKPSNNTIVLDLRKHLYEGNLDQIRKQPQLLNCSSAKCTKSPVLPPRPCTALLSSMLMRPLHQLVMHSHITLK